MEEPTKICLVCAESVKAAALKCRFCGHDFNAPSRGELAADAIGGGMVKVGLIALGVIGLLAYCSSSSGPTPEQADVADTAVATSAITAAQREECRALMARASSEGLIRKLDTGNMQMTVDEPSWRELGPEGRMGVMATASCDWFGVRTDELQEGQRVTIIGWQSGDRLASSMGGLYAGD